MDLHRIGGRLYRCLVQMDKADADDASGSVYAVVALQEKIALMRERKETLERHRQTLDDIGEAQQPLADPGSRSMHSGTRTGVGYSVQTAACAKHNPIAEQQVHRQISEHGLLAETAGTAGENLTAREIGAVAVRG